MDYERILKPDSAEISRFSPSKLRAILLGGIVEKRRRKEEGNEELEESGISLKSEADEIGDTRVNGSNCSNTEESVGVLRPKDHNLMNSRFLSMEEDSLESGSSSSSNFEFQKAIVAERAPPRSPLMLPFSKPTPSKWDDAEKWIASPTANRTIKGNGGDGGSKWLSKTSKFAGSRNKQSKPDTKRIDPNQAKETGGKRDVNLLVDPSEKSDPVVEKLVADSPISLDLQDLTDCSTVMPITSSLEAMLVSTRDMGTEMTPIASHEPSRTGTPVRSTTPTRSHTSSPPLSHTKTVEDSIGNLSTGIPGDSVKKLSEEELKMRTRQEIMVLGQQLGKMNIAAWASNEEEGTNASSSSKTITVDQQAKSATRAAAWEEAEKAKYLARFKQEEAKIQAWENHQKAITEAEMRKAEVDVERMRARANDKLMNKLAAAKHKAEEKRAAAEARKNHQVTKVAKQVEYIRRTGHIPSSSTCWRWSS